MYYDVGVVECSSVWCIIIVHSSSGIVRMVSISWSSCVARQGQCMACCMFSLLCGWAYPLSFHLCEKAAPLDPNIESLWNGVWEQEFVDFR